MLTNVRGSLKNGMYCHIKMHTQSYTSQRLNIHADILTRSVLRSLVLDQYAHRSCHVYVHIGMA